MPTPIRLIATYLATALSFLAVDFIWLTKLSAQVYHPTLDDVVLPTARLGPAAVFYLAYIAGVLVLAIWPTRNDKLLKTTVTGGLLGAMCYATYDLTNQATLVVWATSITLADIAWGTFLTGAAATVGGFVLRKLTPKA
jgi:uncharacterized membrane protein